MNKDTFINKITTQILTLNTYLLDNKYKFLDYISNTEKDIDQNQLELEATLVKFLSLLVEPLKLCLEYSENNKELFKNVEF